MHVTSHLSEDLIFHWSESKGPENLLFSQPHGYTGVQTDLTNLLGGSTAYHPARPSALWDVIFPPVQASDHVQGSKRIRE